MAFAYILHNAIDGIDMENMLAWSWGFFWVWVLGLGLGLVLSILLFLIRLGYKTHICIEMRIDLLGNDCVCSYCLSLSIRFGGIV